MQHNIFAFADVGFAPQFLAVNKVDEGRYEVIVRSAPMGDEACGNTAAVVLNAAIWKEWPRPHRPTQAVMEQPPRKWRVISTSHLTGQQ